MLDTSLEYLKLGPLQTRIETHRRYSEHHDDVEAAVLGELRLQAHESLLDVGCGTGSFLARLRSEGHSGVLAGVDSSPAAVAAASAIADVRAVLADATRLPFPDGEYDAVTARHMLYHVSDLTAALTEARRVLRPGGRFVAVVNHADVTPVIAGVVRKQAERFGVSVPASPNARVNSSTLPPQVKAVFGNVETYTFDNHLVFESPAPVTAFGQALMSFYGVGEDSPVRELVADGIARAVQNWFAEHDGVWRDPKGYVVCVARR